MKRTLLSLLSLFLFLNSLYSQVLISPPPLFKGVKPDIIQLMYGILNNTSSSGLDVYIHVIAKSDGKLIVDANSKEFYLAQGPTLINTSNAQELLYPGKVKYTDNRYLNYSIRTGELIQGEYDVCVSVLKAKNDSILGKTCYSFIIENFTTVNLLTPINKSDCKNAYPIFTWSKVNGSASTFSDDIYYSLKIVEVFDEQSDLTAMQANPSVFKDDDISFNLFQYPLASHPLEPCKKYAWQIEAFQGRGLNKRSLIKSEIWSFREACEQELHWTPSGNHDDKKKETTQTKKSKKPVGGHHAFYYTLSTENKSDVMEVGGTLYVQFENNYSSGSNQLSYYVINLENNETTPSKKPDYAMNQGINRLALTIENAGVPKGGKGLFVLFDGSQYLYLNFKRITDKVTSTREK